MPTCNISSEVCRGRMCHILFKSDQRNTLKIPSKIKMCHWQRVSGPENYSRKGKSVTQIVTMNRVREV